MKKREKMRVIGSVIVVCFALLIIFGCAAKKPFWGDAKSGYILKYNLPKGDSWKYQTNTTQVTTQEMMGQSMEISTNVSSIYSITGAGYDEIKNINATVQMDSGLIKSTSPQGERKIDISAIIGKSFGYSFTPLGKKVKFTDPENIKVDLGMGGKRDSEQFFKNLLPRLTQNPVKIGGTWNVIEKDTVMEGGLEIEVNIKNTNKFEGIETIDGVECFKIIANADFTLEGSGEQMGADILLEGDGESTSTWYFAFKKSTFLKSTTEMLMEGTATVTGPQNMTIPISQETKIAVNLIK